MAPRKGLRRLTSDSPDCLVGALTAGVLSAQDLETRGSERSSSTQDDAAQGDPTTSFVLWGCDVSVTEGTGTPSDFVLALRIGGTHELFWEEGAPPSSPVQQC